MARQLLLATVRMTSSLKIMKKVSEQEQTQRMIMRKNVIVKHEKISNKMH